MRALAVAFVVEKRPVLPGRGAFIFHHPAAHLGDELLLQRLHGAEAGGGIAVLGPEITRDIGRDLLGVFDHLLPVLRAQPGVIIMQRHAMHHATRGLAGGARRAVMGEGGERGHRACHPFGREQYAPRPVPDEPFSPRLPAARSEARGRSCNI